MAFLETFWYSLVDFAKEFWFGEISTGQAEREQQAAIEEAKRKEEEAAKARE